MLDRLAAFVLLATGTASPCIAFESDPAVVDQRPAIAIGRFEVSHYVVDKSFNRFRALHVQRFGQPPAAEEIQEWFRVFLAQQRIKARLKEEGYLERAEVREAVTQVSRKILTQISGPFYRALVDAAPADVESLRTVHAASGRVFDATLVRFDDIGTASEFLGSVDRRVVKERLTALAHGAMSPRYTVHHGEIAWPFHPFEEVTNELLAAQPGECAGPLHKQLGVYFVLVRGERSQPISDFETARPGLESAVEKLRELNIVRVRRHQILREAALQTDREALQRFLTRLRDYGAGRTLLPLAAFADDRRCAVASFLLAGDRQPITPAAFARHLNRRLVRSPFDEASPLVTALEDLVVEEFDHRAAVAAGFDRTPKFVQDCENFALNEALALYERETLLPQITYDDAALKSYHTAHRDRYSAFTRATGELYVFASDRAAIEALRLLRDGDVRSARAAATQTTAPMVVTESGPPLLSEIPNVALIALSDGQTIGPLLHPLGRALFVKRSSDERQQRPFVKVEDEVKRDFIRAKLNALECEVFARAGGVEEWVVEIDFTKYGIESASLERLLSRGVAAPPRLQVRIPAHPSVP